MSEPRSYDVTELVDFVVQVDGSVTIEPKRCRCAGETAESSGMVCCWICGRIMPLAGRGVGDG